MMKNSQVDPEGEQFKKRIFAIRKINLEANEEDFWKYDMMKCKEGNESVFRRTVMMHIIDRKSLRDSLDYTCETLWTCERIPQKHYPSPIVLPRPMPDICVGFREDQLISELANINLEQFHNYMFPEIVQKERSQRAFPFFSMEATGLQDDIMDSAAIRQNWNTASQALHNMYVFMMISGHEKAFFKEVRFFLCRCQQRSLKGQNAQGNAGCSGRKNP